MAQPMTMPNIWISELGAPDTVAEFWKWLTRDGQGREYIACDTETTGLDHFDPSFHIRMIQFGDAESGWALPFQDWKGLVFGALRWLEDHRVRIVWHNLAFDAQALHHEGYKLDMSLQEDTSVWASLGGFAEDSRALKPTGARELGQWVLFGQGLLKAGMSNAGWGWDSVPLNWRPYSSYGVIDTVVTAMLREKWTDRRAKYGWHHSLEIATIDSTNRMERNGFAVDTEYCLGKLAELEQARGDIELQLKTHGVKSAGQNAVVAAVLQEAGVLPEVLKMTESGQISMDKHVLSVVDHPVARLVLKYRGIARTETYLNAMITAAQGSIGPREMAHASIRSIEAKTGRMAISRPALQQMPKSDKDPTVRNAVVPREDGHVLVGADFGQIELRMFASMTKDQALLGVLNKLDEEKAAGNKEADFFVILGKDLYGSDFQKSDYRRNMLKTTCVPLSTPILTKRGWLTHDQVQIGDETIGYNQKTGLSEWTKVTHVHHFTGQPLIRMSHSHHFTTVTTPNHRWLSRHRSGLRWVTTESVKTTDNLIVAAPFDGPGIQITDDEAALLGWILSDGYLKVFPLDGSRQQAGGDRQQVKASISQNVGASSDAIQALLGGLQPYSVTDVHRVWTIPSAQARDLCRRSGLLTGDGARPDALTFVASLSQEQRRRMLESVQAADGLNQSSKPRLTSGSEGWKSEFYRYLVALSGYRTRVDVRSPDGSGWAKNPWYITIGQAPTVTGQRLIREDSGTADVWCVTTELGSWTMEQGGTQLITGNCYAKLYSGGEDTIAKAAKVDPAVISKVIKALEGKYASFATLGDELITRDQAGWHVSTPTGRPFAVHTQGERRKLMNYLVQGHSAEILKMALANAEEAGLGEYFVLPVHDELILSVPESMAEEATRELVSCMDAVVDPDAYGVKVSASPADPAQRWGLMDH